MAIGVGENFEREKLLRDTIARMCSVISIDESFYKVAEALGTVRRG